MQYEGGLSLSRVVSLQKRMFNYHAGLGGDTHYFRSDWYEWPIIWWPMWFYSGSGYLADGMISSISCMGNVGPGFGEVGSMGSYAHLPSILKISLSLEMLLGRLEIFPILYVLFGLRAK